MAFQAGFNKGVIWQATLGAPVSINVIEHSWSEMVDALDITHSGTEGVQALIAGIFRGEGNIKANSDDSQETGTIGVGAGINGVMSFFHYNSSVPTFIVPAMITKINYKTVIAGTVSYDFDIKVNIIAGPFLGPVRP